MMVTLKLQGTLRDFRPAGARVDQFEIELPEGADSRQAAQHFNIPPARIHAIFVNGVSASLDTTLHDGDLVRLFPPVVGGGAWPAGGADQAGKQPWRVFIGGIMQGSRRENTIDAQDYRRIIGDCLRAQLAQVEVIDPFQLHPDSVAYERAQARQTLITLAHEAGRADAVIAFVPEASMGTALEMWEAYRGRKPIFTISPLQHNWVVQCLSTRVFDNIEEFCAYVNSGDFERALRQAA
jgi:molybdopterin converting factor small subunit